MVCHSTQHTFIHWHQVIRCYPTQKVASPLLYLHKTTKPGFALYSYWLQGWVGLQPLSCHTGYCFYSHAKHRESLGPQRLVWGLLWLPSCSHNSHTTKLGLWQVLLTACIKISCPAATGVNQQISKEMELLPGHKVCTGKCGKKESRGLRPAVHLW